MQPTGLSVSLSRVGGLQEEKEAECEWGEPERDRPTEAAECVSAAKTQRVAVEILSQQVRERECVCVCVCVCGVDTMYATQKL